MSHRHQSLHNHFGAIPTMKKQRILSAILVCLFAVTAMAAELTEDEFRTLHAELQPDNTALWRTVPWKTSVLDAQQAAADEQKPIFIWAMDGHPLGCT